MPPIKVLLDSEGNLIIRDPVTKFYLKTDQELIPNCDYYIAFFINCEDVTFTDRFHKVIKDDIELYELDLFTDNTILPFNQLLYDYPITFLGFNYPDITNIIRFTEVYYEKPIDFAPKDLHEIIISYHDSELARAIRETYPDSFRERIKCYGEDIDNVMKFGSGLFGKGYRLDDSYINDIFYITSLIDKVNVPSSLVINSGNRNMIINFDRAN